MGRGQLQLHIAVDFKHPTEADFEQFVRTLKQQNETKTWVHCAANMRVSAFMYRYRRDVLGEDEALAAADMRKVWEPFGVWKAFVSPLPNDV